MKATVSVLVLAGVLAGCRSCPCKDQKNEPAETTTHAAASSDPAYVLGYEMNRIDGLPERLDAFEGKVVLMVNVASKCGLTPQYAKLESLYRERQSDGLVILGFPANDFNGQEPGTNAEIVEFCHEKYDVTFPMFEKIAVLGESAHPLYQQLSSLPAPAGGAPSWNFTKYLVDRHGRVIQRFDPRTAPDDPALLAAIDAALQGS